MTATADFNGRIAPRSCEGMYTVQCRFMKLKHRTRTQPEGTLSVLHVRSYNIESEAELPKAVFCLAPCNLVWIG